MCRLLGLIANKKVDMEFSLKLFKRFATKNHDGWGIGWYENREVKVFKQGIPAYSQKSRYPQLSKRVRSDVIIAHIRKGTGAKPAEWNSHPFKCENWLFAHNGFVDREHIHSQLNRDYKDRIKGGTDSEVYFYWILQNIEERGSAREGIRKAVQEVVKKEHTGLNFLLADGMNLYAFRYSTDPRNKFALYKLKRAPSDRDIFEYLSEKTKAYLHSKSLRGEESVMVCSERLTKERWTSIKSGNLIRIGSNLRIEDMKIL